MKAVNLIPGDLSAAGATRSSQDVQAAVYGLLGVLGLGVGMMSLYVLDGNKIAQSRVQVGALKTESDQVQAQIGQLGNYVNFQQLAESRAQSVRQIVSGNFDWAAALAQLSRVVPANTTLQTLSATTAAAGTTGAATAGAAAGASGPSFELTGCTSGQVAVAGLMSRLRLISGVTRVALNSSVKAGSSAGAAGAGAAASSSTEGCGRLDTTFDMLVTFSAPSGSAIATSATPASAATAGGGTPAPAAAPAPSTTTPTTTGAAR